MQRDGLLRFCHEQVVRVTKHKTFSQLKSFNDILLWWILRIKDHKVYVADVQG
jgi:hypothetical protein